MRLAVGNPAFLSKAAPYMKTETAHSDPGPDITTGTR